MGAQPCTLQATASSLIQTNLRFSAFLLFDSADEILVLISFRSSLLACIWAEPSVFLLRSRRTPHQYFYLESETCFIILCGYHPEKYIKPKLDLFVAAGFTGNSIAKLFSNDPGILKNSLERKLSPNLHLLMTILDGDRKAAAKSIAGSTWILSLDLKKHMLPNIETLREHGVSGANISKLVKLWPRVLTQEPVRFSKSVTLLEDMGFDPSNVLFIQGIKVNVGLAPQTWERKLQLYRSLGWSQEETLSAFKKNPLFLLISEEKVRKVVAFFVENLKWEPSRLALVPIVLCYSFERRIVPRFAVFNILSTSGLSGMNISFSTLLNMGESTFLKKYVCKYSDTVPELLDAYKAKLDMAVAVPSNCVL
ncbi:hypothetical protein KSP40_PGU018448 [Platanthera guangdongensis]|uniref:mTERF protein n=1 Tax=Platanthera guangdongensis TaxID=2320717 RepID=A0ABR2LE50_9ASPA